jgi:GNAT superfamily N-acetyltransferase
MNKIISIHDKEELESFFRKNAPLYIYSIGDLDDFYWNNTIWYGLKNDSGLQAVVLLYTAANPPVLIALCNDKEMNLMKELATGIFHLLPNRFYSHLSPCIETFFEKRFSLSQNGNYCKMLLDKDKMNCGAEPDDVQRLTIKDVDSLNILYAESYPDNSFDPRMLETGMYFGMKENKKIISVAGVHVFSKQYRVAALGNITTHRDHRGKGLGTKVTMRLCRELVNHADIIGLNVSINNISAIRCYEKIGFRRIALYNEFMVEKV